MLGVIRIVLGMTLFADAVLLALLLKERASILKTVFAVYIAGIAGWTLSILLNTWVTGVLVAYFVYAFAALFLTAQIWFAKLFPGGALPKRRREYWSLALGAFFLVSSFVPGALFSSITFAHGYVVVHNGFLAQWYSLFVVLYSALPVAILFKKRRSANDETVRAQLSYLSLGFSAFLVLIVLANSVLPVFFGIYVFNVAGPVCSLALAASVFYVIWRYKFLDIPVAVQRGVIYSFLFALVIGCYWSGLLFAHEVLSFKLANAALGSAGVVTAIGVFTIPLLERYFRKLTDRLFFKDRYDYALALESLSELLSTSADFDELISRMQENLATVLRAQYVRVLVPEAVRDERAARLQESLELFEPIRADGKAIGSILVGGKLSGDRYRTEDKTLLRTFALQAATALGRAQLFRQVRQHALELEEKVAERTAQLEAARENERRMMLDIAHGIKTPLAVLGTKLDSLGSGATLNALRQSLKQVSDFASDLLELARLEHIESPRFENCPLSDIANELCEELEVIASARGIRIARRIEPNVFVRADARELRTAVMNLAANSIAYMRESGDRAISVHLATQASSAILSIRDTGVGIAADDLAHIFDRFYRAGHASVAGSGLGLAISKRIVELHGGTLTATSIPGNGTTMTITLPRAASPQSAA